MAMAKCKECGAEVSDSAKTCPKCGKSNPTNKTSLLVKVIIGFFVLGGIGQYMKVSPPSGSSSSGSVTPSMPSVADLSDKVTVKDFKWTTYGGGSLLKLSSITIENKNAEDVKDFVIKCTNHGPSGTVTDTNERTLFEILKAGQTKTYKDFDMGFIHSQATSSGCHITGVSRIN